MVTSPGRRLRTAMYALKTWEKAESWESTLFRMPVEPTYESWAVSLDSPLIFLSGACLGHTPVSGTGKVTQPDHCPVSSTHDTSQQLLSSQCQVTVSQANR